MKVILVVHLLSPVSKVFTPNYLLKVINMCGVWLWHPDNHLCLVCVCERENYSGRYAKCILVLM